MHHSAVRVSLNMSLSPLDWRVQPHMTTRTSLHARPGMLRETSSELLCSIRFEDVDQGYNVLSPRRREIKHHRTLLSEMREKQLL